MSKWGEEEKETIKSILNEIKRVLKNNGRILLDFATDILRLDVNNNPVTFNNEGNYTVEQAINIFKDNLKGFDINIEKASFKEENLDRSAGYKFIEGKFLVISGESSRYKTLEVKEER